MRSISRLTDWISPSDVFKLTKVKSSAENKTLVLFAKSPEISNHLTLGINRIASICMELLESKFILLNLFFCQPILHFLIHINFGPCWLLTAECQNVPSWPAILLPMLKIFQCHLTCFSLLWEDVNTGQPTQNNAVASTLKWILTFTSELHREIFPAAAESWLTHCLYDSLSCFRSYKHLQQSL